MLIDSPGLTGGRTMQGMDTPNASSAETTTLRVLRWGSLTALLLFVAAAVLELPLGEIAAPWLLVIAIAAYATYAVIDIRRRRRTKRVTAERSMT